MENRYNLSLLHYVVGTRVSWNIRMINDEGKNLE